MSNISINYDFKPRKWQVECIKKQKRFTVLAVHRRAGKTTLSIGEVVLAALQKTGLYAYIAPELKQAKLIAWKALKDACEQFRVQTVQGKKIQVVEYRESELIVKFLHNGSEIRLFGADNPDSLRGSKLAGAIIDEVAQMPKELWLEIVYPALMDSQGWALFIGTPKGINLFSELFDRGLQPAFEKTWVSLRFTCYETDALNADDIEEYRCSVPEEVFKREMLCDFNANAANQLISLFDAQEAGKRKVDPELISRNKLIMGVDVARFGADDSVICFRRGLLCEDPIVLKGYDVVSLANVIRQKVVERKPASIYIDGTGVGGGVVDVLSNWGIWANDINFGHKSLDGQYTNKRTEMWCKMADWIGKGGCIPDNPSLISELAMPTFDYNDKNQKVLESKKQIRDRLGKSPDLADALCLTFADDVIEDMNTDNGFNHFDGFEFVRKSTPWERFENDIRSRSYYR